LSLLRGSPAERRDARGRDDLRIDALGSGSDYTPFIQHLGIAALNLGYGGEGNGGSYHSIYDSFDHYTRFIDPTFDYGIALAQTAGRAVLRFANADVLPIEFGSFADTVGNYSKEVAQLADDMRENTRTKNLMIGQKTFDVVADPTQRHVGPVAEAPVPFINFAPLQNSLAKLQESVRAYSAAMNTIASTEKLPSLEIQKSLDQSLIRTERAMTLEQGLPRRPWFKNQIYAPGFYTGYGVKTLPGVREAIEQRNWPEAADEIAIVAKTLDQVSGEIDRATEKLRGKQ